MRLLRGVACGVALAGCLARSAVAVEPKPPCTDDVQRLCNLVPPTGSFIQGCLEMHRSALSPECRAHVGEYTRNTVTLRAECRPDIARLCGPVVDRTGRPVPPESIPGAQLSCLLGHRDALSEPCRRTLDDVTHQ